MVVSRVLVAGPLLVCCGTFGSSVPSDGGAFVETVSANLGNDTPALSRALLRDTPSHGLRREGLLADRQARTFRRRLVHGSFNVDSVPYPSSVPTAIYDGINRGAVVIFSTIFWGDPSGYGYWDRLFGMFATAFINAGYTDVHNRTGCITGSSPCTTASDCERMRTCLNSTLGWVKNLFFARRAEDPSYGFVCPPDQTSCYIISTVEVHGIISLEAKQDRGQGTPC